MNQGQPALSTRVARACSMLSVLLLVTLMSGSLALAQETGTFAHTVVPGDTLYRLSQRFGTSVAALVELNDIENPDLIYVGQVLRIPGDRKGTPTSTPGGPLAVSWERVEVRYEGPNYVSTLHIEASGGQPPYTYYHDGLVQEDSTFEIAWRRGRSKPGSVGVEDATGTYVKEDCWLEDPCLYPAGVEIAQPSEGAHIKNLPRHFNVRWNDTIDPPADAYWIEIQVWQENEWQPWQMYRHERAETNLFFVPDAFPGDLGGRLRMWGIYGNCEASEKTPWRYFEFRVTY